MSNVCDYYLQNMCPRFLAVIPILDLYIDVCYYLKSGHTVDLW